MSKAPSQTLSVRVIVTDVWAASVAGQLLASSLINLLCRQVGIVGRVEIIACTTETRILLPGVPKPDAFPSCLEQLAAWAVDDAVTVVAARTDVAADYTVIVGADSVLEAHPADRELLVIGVGWCAWAGERRRAPVDVLPYSTNPLGPFFAATLIAGEIFKRSRGILRGRYLSAAGFSLWSGQTSDRWESLQDGPDLSERSLPPLHVVGAGAVGNGLAYVIANASLAEAYLVVIDDDSYDDTNLNRCVLAGWTDQGQRKGNAIARALTEAHIGVFPFPGSLKDYVGDARVGVRVDIATKINQLEFDVVVSCVDKGTSRHDVQGLRPKLLLGGSTLDLQAKANVYGLWEGAACLACYNPPERDGDKLRALEATLRNMPAEDRRQFLQERALDPDVIEEYLSGAQCGGMGEAALRAFATRPPREFSVGFVSLGAAILLAAALFRRTLFEKDAPLRLDMATVNYLNGGFLDAGLGADPGCLMPTCHRPHPPGF